ncbi:MAG: hypothetical protein Q9Q13_13875 [Acidobacteriota bacterium]|nr:hypothetical protein [Acidobacteriota bacterium]
MKPASGDDFHRLRTAFLRLRAALRDPTTGLYAYSLHFDEVRALLTRRRRVGWCGSAWETGDWWNRSTAGRPTID